MSGMPSPSMSPIVSVQLAERYAARVLAREIVHDEVLDERDLSRRIALLFVPRQSEPVGGERGHHVGQLVAVDVVDLDVAAGVAIAAEGALVERPWRLRRTCRGLLPPAVGRDDIDLAVAVDVPCTDAMNAGRNTRLRDGVRFPGAGRIRRVHAHPLNGTGAAVGGVRLPVAVDVLEHDRLRRHRRREHRVSRPAA
jgi:hypothetical protein